ncbi:hypothetical protein A4X09_0g5352 [Tilletia walkeri]|uniref:Uncharacterized protein n=1 Tax=Tilletia walkeri TaxID=117179 RepID=A0A8X7T344_9BASI|nr:hypothetical protein A4X09_0g5352 [Tilletia walkeri]
MVNFKIVLFLFVNAYVFVFVSAAHLVVYDRRNEIQQREGGAGAAIEGLKALAAMGAVGGALYAASLKYTKLKDSIQHPRPRYMHEGGSTLNTPHLLLMPRTLDDLAMSVDSRAVAPERRITPASAKELSSMFKGIQIAAAFTAVPIALWSASH